MMMWNWGRVLGGSRAQGRLPETDLASLAIFPGPSHHLKCED